MVSGEPRVYHEGSLVLKEIAPGVRLEEIRAKTEAARESAPVLESMAFG
jgi:acyl CoA:acetate/3-ketoacid CoA transferase beta subunit